MDSDRYFTSLIYYIHCNAQHHGFVKDFREWEFSSWHNYLSDEITFPEKASVVEWFGNKERFLKAHLGNIPFNDITHLLIE